MLVLTFGVFGSPPNAESLRLRERDTRPFKGYFGPFFLVSDDSQGNLPSLLSSRAIVV